MVDLLSLTLRWMLEQRLRLFRGLAPVAAATAAAAHTPHSGQPCSMQARGAMCQQLPCGGRLQGGLCLPVRGPAALCLPTCSSKCSSSNSSSARRGSSCCSSKPKMLPMYMPPTAPPVYHMWMQACCGMWGQQRRQARGQGLLGDPRRTQRQLSSSTWPAPDCTSSNSNSSSLVPPLTEQGL